MYLRSTILICVLGACGFCLFQQPSLLGFPKVIVNPHVVQEAAPTVGDTSTDKVEPWWLIVLGGLVIAIVAATVMDRLRFRKQPEEDFVYHIHTSVAHEDEYITENADEVTNEIET